MAHTRRTLLLDRETWDITLDSAGRMALTHGDYATAQNVANEARLFTNDAYFNQDEGTPYFVLTLARRANITAGRGNLTALRAYLRRAALKVADVKEVLAVDITGLDAETRRLTGDIQFVTLGGQLKTSPLA